MRVARLPSALVLAACAQPIDLRAPRDAGSDHADAPSARADPYAEQTERGLPPGEGREARCDGEDDDGDGRVDEGFTYAVQPCEACVPSGRPGYRPHLTLAAGFDGGRGAAIWREGFHQSDSSVPYVKVTWGDQLELDDADFLQWRPIGSLAPSSSPARAGSFAFWEEGAVAMWGLSPIACARGFCRSEFSTLDARRRGAPLDEGITPVTHAWPRGSGLVPVARQARVALVRADQGFDLLAVAPDAAVERLGAMEHRPLAEDIGQVRGAAWSDDELVWVYESLEASRRPRLVGFWTDPRGHTTRPPRTLVAEGTLDATWTGQVFVARGAVHVVHWIGARGLFLTRHDPVPARGETRLLTRSHGAHRAAWDGATLFLCASAGIGDTNRVAVQRFSLDAVELSEPLFVLGWGDCAIAARGGRALLAVGLYATRGSISNGALLGVACPKGAGP